VEKYHVEGIQWAKPAVKCVVSAWLYLIACTVLWVGTKCVALFNVKTGVQDANVVSEPGSTLCTAGLRHTDCCLAGTCL
jgi:hypothetical protein